jgi:death on curing protein
MTGKTRPEPHWLSRVIVDALHYDQLREHGGLLGLRDEHALEAALARPQQRWHSDEDADLMDLAASYGFGLVRSHPYRDGNKRVGFLALATFLGLNGCDLGATDADVVTTIVNLAAGRLTEPELAAWIRSHCTRRR